ncbi:venom metalloproteinase BumaMPs1-like isoform X2 [Microplitis demolitor]|uniref:venom metalloproteinase BumaMPs1-like isoform X2 n=1 Tax=Microplitis demolitor TaxID=69319 RepID=UPI0004CCB089|nr:venom metalloproteinase BumaMPs1-like isoform X2 [Microplitis demolitor]
MIRNNIIIMIVTFFNMSLVIAASVGPENLWQRTPRILNNDDWERGTINFLSRRKRSSINDDINLQLNAFGKNIYLNLQEKENTLYSSATPVHQLYSNSLMSQTIKIKGPNIQRKIYEDSQNRASFVLDTLPNGRRIIQNGYIGSENLTISADYSLLLEQSSILLNSWNTPSTNTYIFRRVQHNNYPFANPIELNYYNYRVPSKYNNNIQIPSTIYLEILVIIDYELFTRVGPNQILTYVLTFWNQVDTLYRSLDQPKYKLNIAGIVLPMDPVVLEYFSKDSNGRWYSESISYHTLVTENGKWLFKSQELLPLESYDIAVTMTPRQEEPIAVSPNEYRATVGISALNGACLIDHRYGQTHSVAIILDDGNFSGVQTAAHEIGHLLGSRHDKYPCPESDGYIMAPSYSSTENRFKWSRCTLRDFAYFLRTNPQCLYNRPRTLP